MRISAVYCNTDSALRFALPNFETSQEAAGTAAVVKPSNHKVVPALARDVGTGDPARSPECQELRGQAEVAAAEPDAVDDGDAPAAGPTEAGSKMADRQRLFAARPAAAERASVRSASPATAPVTEAAAAVPGCGRELGRRSAQLTQQPAVQRAGSPVSGTKAEAVRADQSQPTAAGNRAAGKVNVAGALVKVGLK